MFSYSIRTSYGFSVYGDGDGFLLLDLWLFRALLDGLVCRARLGNSCWIFRDHLRLLWLAIRNIWFLLTFILDLVMFPYVLCGGFCRFVVLWGLGYNSSGLDLCGFLPSNLFVAIPITFSFKTNVMIVLGPRFTYANFACRRETTLAAGRFFDRGMVEPVPLVDEHAFVSFRGLLRLPGDIVVGGT